MEEQAQAQPASTPTSPASTLPVNQTSKPLMIVVVLIFLLMTGSLVYLGYQNYQLQQKVNQLLEQQTAPLPTPTTGFPSPSPSADLTANWNSYLSQAYGFSIKYPKTISKYQGEWEYKEFPSQDGAVWVGFRPSSIKEDYLWGVNVYTNKSVEQAIKEQGQQFSDRKESRQNISVNGAQAQLVTVTTNQFEGWISKTVLIENEGKVYVIGNGAIEIPEFEQFYMFFKLLN